jgi:hypothetical protein
LRDEQGIAVHVETLLADEASRMLGCDTVSLLDPVRRVQVPGVSYLECANSEWTSRVQGLLAKATFVCFVLPPGAEGGDGIIWELYRTLDRGLIGRILLLIPTKDMDPGGASRRSLLRFGSERPEWLSFKLGTYAIAPDDKYECRGWHFETETSGRALALGYAKAVREFLKGIMDLERLTESPPGDLLFRMYPELRAEEKKP